MSVPIITDAMMAEAEANLDAAWKNLERTALHLHEENRILLAALVALVNAKALADEALTAARAIIAKVEGKS